MTDLRTKLETEYANAKWSQETRDTVWGLAQNLGGLTDHGVLTTAAYAYLAQAVSCGMEDAATT